MSGEERDILDGNVCGICQHPFTSSNGYMALCQECWLVDPDESEELGFQESEFPLLESE
jgi:hypothetical protein